MRPKRSQTFRCNLSLFCALLTLSACSLAQDCGQWTNKTPQSPGPYYGYAMAYDSQRNVAVLFTGSDQASTTGYTWEWNGTTWSLRSMSGPPLRYGSAMAYD